MRKFLAILSALLIAASLCACNNGGEEETTDGKININDETNDNGETNNNGGTNNGETGTGENGNEITPPEVDDPENADYVTADDTVYIIHPNGAVKLHGAGDTKDTSLKNGSELKRIAISEKDGWSKVLYNEETYYVVTSCLTTMADFDEGFVEVEKTLTLAVTSLNIRNTPSMDNQIIGYLSADIPVKVIAENTTTGWYKVEFTAYGGATETGYVVSDAKYYTEETTTTDAEDADDSNSENADGNNGENTDGNNGAGEGAGK